MQSAKSLRKHQRKAIGTRKWLSRCRKRDQLLTMNRNPLMRTLIIATLLLLLSGPGGRSRSTAAAAPACSGEIAGLAAQHRRIACPGDPVGPLQLLPKRAGLRCATDLFICRDVGAAYLHGLEAGAGFAVDLFDAFCQAATGKRTERIPGWDRKAWSDAMIRGSPCDPDVVCGSNGWQCFVNVRDPVERVLAGFHEVMSSQESSSLRKLLPRLEEGAATEAKLEALDAFLDLAQHSRKLEHRTGLQSQILSKRHQIKLFRTEEGEQPVRDFLCGLYECRTRSGPGNGREFSCGAISALENSQTKIEQSQYTLDLAELPVNTTRRITALYRADYCRLGYAPKAGAEDIIDCSSGQTAERESTARRVILVKQANGIASQRRLML